MKLRKQIRGYEGLYEIRSDGAIISINGKRKSAGGFRWERRAYVA